jgi:hypothetical protein
MPTRSLHFKQRRMRAVTSLLLAVTMTITTQAQKVAPRARIHRVKRGQVLEFSVLNSVDSAHAHKGDDFPLTLTHALVVDGVTVLPAGWIAHTKIKKAVPAGKVCKMGHLDWKLSRLDMPGKAVKLEEIPKYLAKPHDQLIDWVSLDSAPTKILHKTANGLYWLAVSPLLVFVIPLAVLAGIGELKSRDCAGYPGLGLEAHFAAGTFFYYAITEDADVMVN